MNIIDLSHEFKEGMMVYPNDPKFRINNIFNHNKDGYHLDELSFGTHTGTHIDVPFHFIENGKSITDYDINYFVKKGTIIDVSYKRDNEIISIEDLYKYRKYIIKNDFVIIKTGYSKYYGDKKYISHPYLSKEAAIFLKDLNIKIIGIDTFSVDSTFKNDSFGAHEVFLNNDILIVENLNNLDKLDNDKTYTFSFIPLNIKNADGSPVRAYAYL